ncbi:MAG: hypothetical protein SGARI_004974 [Bacillariaceae sp.]
MTDDSSDEDTTGSQQGTVSAFAHRPGLEQLVAEALASPAKSIQRRSRVDFGESDSDDGLDIYGLAPVDDVRRNLLAVEEEEEEEKSEPPVVAQRRGRSRGQIPCPSPSPPTVPMPSLQPKNTPHREPPTNAEIAFAAAAAAAELQSPVAAKATLPPGASTPAGRATRKSPQGTTTARKPKKAKAATAIRVNGRVFTTRKKVFLTVLSEGQRASVRDFADHFRLFGTVISGKGKDGYNVEFDIFPAGDKVVKGLVRKLCQRAGE